MTTRKAARPLRRYVRARVRPALLVPASYTIPRDATQIKVPSLMFAGGKDTYKSCCMIDRARKLNAGAKKAAEKPKLELVEYPDAQHGFILSAPSFNKVVSADAMKRTLAHLRAGLGDAKP